MRSECPAQEDVAEARGASPRSRVLVAVMNSLRDFEIARQEGWYRIPLRHAPYRVGADYIAFYQTKAFGEERWAVNYYAPIRRFHIVCRRDLLPQEPDHPRANELYYKIEIGALERLPRAIPSRRLRRLTFIPTTWERLLSAEEINDLWCGGAAQERLWRAFKEKGICAERCYPLTDEAGAPQVDFALLCEEGKVAVFCQESTQEVHEATLQDEPLLKDYELGVSGWTVLRLTPYEVSRSLDTCLAAVMAAVAQNGGVLPDPHR